MNQDNINKYLENNKGTPSPEMCIRQVCLLCQGDSHDEKLVCTEFGCPLWLYRAEEGFEGDDFFQRIHIIISTCRVIHESK